MALLTTRSQRIVIGVLVLLVALGGLFVYNQFFREEPAPFFASDEEHFLYGSVGTEADQGVPYWIWLVLPRIFPEYMPRAGGYAAIGVIARDGHEMPIGLSRVTVGFPRVGINCAMCHTASFRATPDAVPTIYPAAASHQTGEQEYLRFLIKCASDPRFTPTTILNEIAKNTRLSYLGGGAFVSPEATHAAAPSPSKSFQLAMITSGVTMVTSSTRVSPMPSSPSA